MPAVASRGTYALTICIPAARSVTGQSPTRLSATLIPGLAIGPPHRPSIRLLCLLEASQLLVACPYGSFFTRPHGIFIRPGTTGLRGQLAAWRESSSSKSLGEPASPPLRTHPHRPPRGPFRGRARPSALLRTRARGCSLQPCRKGGDIFRAGATRGNLPQGGSLILRAGKVLSILADAEGVLPSGLRQDGSDLCRAVHLPVPGPGDHDLGLRNPQPIGMV